MYATGGIFYNLNLIKVPNKSIYLLSTASKQSFNDDPFNLEEAL